ncbi:hypothetical protein HDU80_007496 [Chytriomyces hyalinus]|nr:hypothetical protein HDU80_007496 [Chytriomyces hyalinus]
MYKMAKGNKCLQPLILAMHDNLQSLDCCLPPENKPDNVPATWTLPVLNFTLTCALDEPATSRHSPRVVKEEKSESDQLHLAKKCILELEQLVLELQTEQKVKGHKASIGPAPKSPQSQPVPPAGPLHAPSDEPELQDSLAGITKDVPDIIVPSPNVPSPLLEKEELGYSVWKQKVWPAIQQGKDVRWHTLPSEDAPSMKLGKFFLLEKSLSSSEFDVMTGGAIPAKKNLSNQEQLRHDRWADFKEHDPAAGRHSARAAKEELSVDDLGDQNGKHALDVWEEQTVEETDELHAAKMCSMELECLVLELQMERNVKSCEVSIGPAPKLPLLQPWSHGELSHALPDQPELQLGWTMVT